MIKENPEIVERFLRATIRGIKATLENPNEAADILAKRDAKIDRNLEYKRLLMYNEVTSNSKKYSTGYMDYKMIKETYDRLKEEKVITQEFDVNKAFTTKFLEKIYS